MWVRGLKQAEVVFLSMTAKSHPMWVRGLKRETFAKAVYDGGRTLCGCVD